MATEFSSDQYHSSYPEGGQFHWWPLARSRIVRQAIARTVREGSSILDIGCGRGIVVSYLRKSGLECSGIEPGAARPVEGAEHYIRTGLHASELPAEERQAYDTVLLLDVIEHLPDVPGFLRELQTSFANLSSVILTVPARQELWSNYDEYFGHYRRYSRPMLKELANELGWELRELRYFFHSLYLPAWFMAKVRKGRATELTPPRGPFKTIHRLLAWGMFVDSVVLPQSLPGSSLIASLKLR